MIIALAVMAMSSAQGVPPPSNTLTTLHGMYQQSCQVKAYGSYDDICNGLKRQIKEAEKQAKRERSQAKPAPPAAEAKPSEASPAEPAAATTPEPAPKG